MYTVWKVNYTDSLQSAQSNNRHSCWAKENLTHAEILPMEGRAIGVICQACFHYVPSAKHFFLEWHSNQQSQQTLQLGSKIKVPR